MKPLSFNWEWKLRSTPEALWPYVSDTNRFNHDSGLPTVEIENKKNSAGIVPKRYVKTKALGMLIDWEESIFEWARPYHFQIERNYLHGPILTASLTVDLKEIPEGGTLLSYRFQCQPRNPFASFLLPLQLERVTKKQFERTFRRYDKQIQENQQAAPLETSAAAPESFKSFAAQSALHQRLASWISEAPAYELSRIRPYELAQKWQVNRKELLSIFLHGVEKGLLEFQWEVLCPHCRVAENPKDSLEKITQSAYCTSCDLHFDANFDELVELTFRPHPSVRATSRNLYCTGGPQATPHIAFQQQLQPQQTITLPVRLEEGRYRARRLYGKTERFFTVSSDGTLEASIQLSDDTISSDYSYLAPKNSLRVTNESTEPVIFILEKLARSENAVCVCEVLHIPTFRDLFQAQRLRPGEQISLGNIAIVFTDLLGSTRLYQEIGDPAAFGKVMNHFDVLKESIQKHHGVLIKTIGDAVMASFRNPKEALLAVAEAQQKLSGMIEKPLFLKAGIHYGPALAVTLNNRLDYFGSTINIAARLVSLSNGRDLIISEQAAAESGLTAPETSLPSFFKLESFQTTIKGFGTEVFPLYRAALR